MLSHAARSAGQLLVAGLSETLGSECQWLSLPLWRRHRYGGTLMGCVAASGFSPRRRFVEGALGCLARPERTSGRPVLPEKSKEVSENWVSCAGWS